MQSARALEAFKSKYEDHEDRLVEQLQDLQQQVRKLQSRKSVKEGCSKEAQPATHTQSEDRWKPWGASEGRPANPMVVVIPKKTGSVRICVRLKWKCATGGPPHTQN